MKVVESLYQIRTPHFTAGLQVENGIVAKAAPIIRYMIGWSPEHVLQYCRSKKWFCDWTL